VSRSDQAVPGATLDDALDDTLDDTRSRERFTALYRAHYDAILAYATRRTDPASARDVAAETFLVAWRRLASVPAEPDATAPWLYGVARRVLSNAERSRGRADRVAAKLLTERDGGGVAVVVTDPAEEVAERARILQALGRLSEVDQETLRLVCWEDLDLSGAAAAMGCSTALVAVRLHRARARMARALRAAEQADDDGGIAGREPTGREPAGREPAGRGPSDAVEESG
jgi:RNA polymerase sigma-70 factor, ECF subfamily